MANNPYINKVVYGNNTLLDLSNSTVDSYDIRKGEKVYDASGAYITGKSYIPGEYPENCQNSISTLYFAADISEFCEAINDQIQALTIGEGIRLATFSIPSVNQGSSIQEGIYLERTTTTRAIIHIYQSTQSGGSIAQIYQIDRNASNYKWSTYKRLQESVTFYVDRPISNFTILVDGAEKLFATEEFGFGSFIHPTGNLTLGVQDIGKTTSVTKYDTAQVNIYQEEKLVNLDFSGGVGNVVVPSLSSYLLKKVTINKPGTLEAGNIKYGTVIAGVTGSYGEPESKTVDLNFPINGGQVSNQVVVPSTNKLLNSVTIQKPATLIESNIRSGTSIGGITGTLSPTPAWLVNSTEQETWSVAYFNPSINWSNILTQSLSYDSSTGLCTYKHPTLIAGALGATYSVVSGTQSIDLSGLFVAFHINDIYVLAYADLQSNSVTPIYAVGSGTIEQLEVSVSNGWNNYSVNMPPNTISVLFYYPTTDGINTKVLAATPIAFGNWKQPSGTLTITENGTYDVSGYANVVVNIGGSGENISVSGDTLIFDGNTTVSGDTLTLDSDASVSDDTLTFTSSSGNAMVNREQLFSELNTELWGSSEE